MRMICFKLLFILLACCTCVQAQQIVDVNKSGSYPQEKNPNIVSTFSGNAERYRRFEINPLLKNFSRSNEQDTLSLFFFENLNYKAIVQQVSRSNDGITSITAKIIDNPYGYCFISISETDIAISAELPALDEYFSVKKTGGYHYLYAQKLSAMPHESCESCQSNHHETAAEPIHFSSPVRGGSGLFYAQPESTTPVTIDLLVVYTPAARAWATQNGTNISLQIDQAVQRANLVMQNSLTYVTFNLVHKQEVNYTESGNTNTDLRNLRDVANDKADEVHAWRTRYNADMVAMVIGGTTSTVAGAGYFIGNDSYGAPKSAFSVVRVETIATGYTMVHEMGHNFGCGHHLDTDSQGMYSYSHGWKGTTTQGKRATVMTYENGGYLRIPYFSDPNITAEGTVIGNATDGNNAKTIRQTKGLVANYSSEVPLLDNFLSNITLSAGTLTPQFNPGIKQYTVSVGNNVTTIDVIGIPNSNSATVSGNVTGRTLAVGSNVVNIGVDDAMGNYATRTYTVTITRQNVLPQPPTVIFPTVAAVSYNPTQKLRDITWNNAAGDGTFRWINPDSVPTVINNGYEMMFTPNNTTAYDYSNIVLRRVVQVTVNKAQQTINFPPIPNKLSTDTTFHVGASINTGLPLTYESDNTAIATIAVDGRITILDSGSVTITVKQAGNANYLPAAKSNVLIIKSPRPSSLNDIQTSGNVFLLSNPVYRNETVCVDLRLYKPLGSNTVLEIYQITGKLLRQISVTNNLFEIPAPNKSGIYMYVLKANGQILENVKMVVL